MESYLCGRDYPPSGELCPWCKDPALKAKHNWRGGVEVALGIHGTKTKLWRGLSDSDGKVYDFCPHWFCGYRAEAPGSQLQLF